MREGRYETPDKRIPLLGGYRIQVGVTILFKEQIK